MILKSTINIFGILILGCIMFSLNGCKKNETVPVTESLVMDIDSNVYKTIKINNRWWMTENLKVKRYRNGDSITFVSEKNFNLDSAKWNHLNTGAYCIIDNAYATAQNYKGKMFGFLYNYYAVADSRNIAPEGWHVATEDEWKDLETSLGMNQDDINKLNWRGTDQGNKLKNQDGWDLSSDKFLIWGNNESRFNAIGGGCCMFNGVWSNPKTFKAGFWWTASPHGDQVWYRYLDYNKSGVFRYYGPKTYGFSIRCVKD